MKPTGTAHIGNYFGALKQWVDLQEAGAHDCFFMIADYHALNFIQDAGQMHALTTELARTLLAIGLDPERVTIFKQSTVAAHTELTWIFDTITTMPYLMRAHAFKDAEAKDKEINVGTFNYPMLMAADILLYDAKAVPVGQDQKQHIEYARDTAEKFNRVFNAETFILPEPYIMPEVAIVPGTDGQKMSKSYGNTIPLFATHEELTKAVMGIVTDSSGERPGNVYAIHRLVRSEDELDTLYEENKGQYKALKEALIEDLEAFIAPMRKRYEALEDSNEIDKVLTRGAEVARARTDKKMYEVRSAIGVS
ncbi:MAG: Tryptophan--tRNA ligase [Parcubacteria group bacterium]|nr:Tryptophan--tRNA ligase [Parcubacteria group bacterium]